MKKVVTEYKLVRGSCDYVEGVVNRLLTEGFQPKGAPVSAGDYKVIQAMVKKSYEGSEGE